MRIRFVLAVGVAVLLAVVIAGCSGEQGPESSDGSRGGLGDLLSPANFLGPSWSEYMPVQNGRVCKLLYSEDETVNDTLKYT